jgi:4-amino-4-deoxy-L-arabinose transferase
MELLRWAAFAALLILLSAAFQGSRGLWEPDEGRYTAIALEMLRGDDWLVPKVDPQHPHYAKPPLLYWSIAASVSVFGRNEWAVRLPNTLAFLLSGCCLIWLGSLSAPPRPFWTPIVWSTMAAPSVFANIVTLDTVLALWETLAMTGCIALLLADDAERRRQQLLNVLTWGAWGIAFLTKGPPGLLPLLAVTTLLLARRDRQGLLRLYRLPGPVVFALIGFSWYVVLALRTRGLLAYFLDYEFIDRIFTGIHGRNAAWYAPLVVYVPILAIGCLPWLPWMLRRAGAARQLQRREFWLSRDQPLLPALLAVWILVPLLVFALSQSRLPSYVLPLFVPLALLAARAIDPPRTARGYGALAVWIVLLLGVRAVAAGQESDKNSRALAMQIKAVVDVRAFDELVFVETPPMRGLSLYLDRPIEHARVAPPSDVRAPLVAPHTVCREITEPQRSLILLRSEDGPRLAAAVSACGAPALQPIGVAGRYLLLRVRELRLETTSVPR